MVREAIIMLEVEGYVEVRKGSGIHVVSNQPRHQQAADNNMEFANYGPFELLQARQLIESNIAGFALGHKTGHHEIDGHSGAGTRRTMLP